MHTCWIYELCTPCFCKSPVFDHTKTLSYVARMACSSVCALPQPREVSALECHPLMIHMGRQGGKENNPRRIAA